MDEVHKYNSLVNTINATEFGSDERNQAIESLSSIINSRKLEPKQSNKAYSEANLAPLAEQPFTTPSSPAPPPTPRTSTTSPTPSNEQRPFPSLLGVPRPIVSFAADSLQVPNVQVLIQVLKRFTDLARKIQQERFSEYNRINSMIAHVTPTFEKRLKELDQKRVDYNRALKGMPHESYIQAKLPLEPTPKPHYKEYTPSDNVMEFAKNIREYLQCTKDSLEGSKQYLNSKLTNKYKNAQQNEALNWSLISQMISDKIKLST